MLEKISFLASSKIEEAGKFSRTEKACSTRDTEKCNQGLKAV